MRRADDKVVSNNKKQPTDGPHLTVPENHGAHVSLLRRGTRSQHVTTEGDEMKIARFLIPD